MAQGRTGTEMNSRIFQPPPEAPVIEPTAEEFADTISFLTRISPIVHKYGICKIRPPSSWRSPFCINWDKLRFNPRLQQINELEAQTRVKLEFLDKLAQFWDLQGQSFKVPLVDRKPLDLSSVFKAVIAEGGCEEVTRYRKWRGVARKLNLEHAVSTIKHHYEKLLFPYERFLVKENKVTTPQGSPQGTPQGTPLKAMGSLHSQTVHSSDERRSCSPVKDEDAAQSSPSSPTVCSDSAQHPLRRSRRYQEVGPEGLSNCDGKMAKELRKLQFLAPGPKALLSDLTPRGTMSAASLAMQRKKLARIDLDPDYHMRSKGRQPLGEEAHSSTSRRTSSRKVATGGTPQKYNVHRRLEVCLQCDQFNHQEEVLVCCRCCAAYHTFCLDPPWEHPPSTDWRCTKCLSEEYNKPAEVYGFEQAKREYSLREYARMANDFKEEYFSLALEDIPCSMVEQEYWTVVSELDSGVVVEYGADLHCSKHGSGFPNLDTARTDEEKFYAQSGWNLNNLPTMKGCVLRHINRDISGMKIPWLYAGMCFSSFCWHVEDHWMYSINYLHRGEPKTWYGVPSSYAMALEQTMKEVAPELFEKQPDLMHHLVTILSPNELMKNGIPVVRTDQHEGEFIVTAPRAYHAGFNQGFNVAEAVNYALPDWLPFGRRSMAHYGLSHRPTVFSHDELLCSIAEQPRDATQAILKACYEDMKDMIKEEEETLRTVANLGVVDLSQYECVHFEKLADSQRECAHCLTTCFLSAFNCPCMKDAAFACLKHLPQHASCGLGQIKIKYRYTLGQLKGLLEKLHELINPMKEWEKKAKKVLKRCGDSGEKEDLSSFKVLCTEGRQQMESLQYQSDVVGQLSSIVEEAEMCERVAIHLLSYERAEDSSRKPKPVLNFSELQNVVSKLEKLPCSIQHKEELMACHQRVIELQLRLAIEKEISSRTLEMCDTRVNSSTERLMEEYDVCGVVISEGEQLKAIKDLKGWCAQSNKLTALQADESKNSLPDAVKHLSTGEELKQTSLLTAKAFDKHLNSIKEAIQQAVALRKSLDAALLLSEWDSLKQFEPMVEKFKACPFHLIEGEEMLRRYNLVFQLFQKAAVLSKKGARPLTMTEAKELITGANSLPVKVKTLQCLESRLTAAKEWLKTTEGCFLRRPSKQSLLEVLLPRSSPCDAVFKKLNTDGSSPERSYTFVQVLHKLGNFEKSCRMIKEREGREMPFFAQLRHDNLSRAHTAKQSCSSCNGDVNSVNLLACELCKGNHHLECVAQCRTNGTLADPYFYLFLCPSCVRTRRPTLAEACKLYKNGTMAHIYLPELAALSSLIRRTREWQMKLSTYLTGLLTGNGEHARTESSPLRPEDGIAARLEEATTAAKRIDSEPADSDVAGVAVGEDGGLPDVTTTQPLSDDGISETSSTGAMSSSLFNPEVHQHNGLDMKAITAQLQAEQLSSVTVHSELRRLIIQGATIELRLPEIDTICRLLQESIQDGWHSSQPASRPETLPVHEKSPSVSQVSSVGGLTMSSTASEDTMSDQDGDEVRITKVESPTVSSLPQKPPVQLHIRSSVSSSSTPAVAIVPGPTVRQTVITGSGVPLFSRTSTSNSQMQQVLPSAVLPSPTLPNPLLSPSALQQQRTSASSNQARTVVISRMGDPNYQHIPQFLPTQHQHIDPALQVHPQGQTVSLSSLGVPRSSVHGVTTQLLQANPGISKTYRVVQNVDGSEAVVVVPKPAHQPVQHTSSKPITHATVQPGRLPTPTSANVALDPYRFLHPVLPQPKVHPSSSQQQQPGGQRHNKRPVPTVLFEPQYTKRARFYTVVTQGIPPQPQVCQAPPEPTTGATPRTVESTHHTIVQRPKGLPAHPVTQPTSVQRTTPLVQGQFAGMPATMAARQGM